MADSMPILSDRQAIEIVIEALIARLDDLDGDCDLEDGHDAEPDYREASYEPSPVHHYDCSPIRLAVRA